MANRAPQWLKVLASGAFVSLSYDPGAQTKVEGESQAHVVVLGLLQVSCRTQCLHTHQHT